MLAAEHNKSINCHIEIEMIVQWIWYFIKYYQDKNEVELSFELLTFYLTKPDQYNHFGELSNTLHP